MSSTLRMTLTVLRPRLPPPVTKKSDPFRTCVGCRQRRPAQVLVRVHLSNGSLILQASGRARHPGGRGAWLCRATLEACVVQAVKVKAFDRAYRQPVAARSLDEFIARITSSDGA